MSKPSRLIYFLFVILGFSSASLWGQESTLRSQVRTLELRNIGPKKYSEIDGNPYYTDKFIESVVYLKDGNFASLPLRYDIFQDQMEFMKDNKTLWLVKKDIKYLRYGSDMIFVSSADGDTSKIGYYFLKDNGKIKLFYRKVVRYQPMVEPKGFADAIPEKLSPEKDEIFIRKENLPARKIVSRKDLTTLFAGDEAALGFIKTHKTKPDNIEDLHALVSFLNKE